LPGKDGPHFLGVNNVKYFRRLLGQGLQHNEIFLRLLDLDDVHNLVVECYFVREVNFAKLAVQLFEFQNNLASVLLAGAFCF
jgi:hypothetical protein